MFVLIRRPPRSTLFPTRRSSDLSEATLVKALEENGIGRPSTYATIISVIQAREYVNKVENRFKPTMLDRKSTRLNSSHSQISYAVFCLKKKKKQQTK